MGWGKAGCREGGVGNFWTVIDVITQFCKMRASLTFSKWSHQSHLEVGEQGSRAEQQVGAPPPLPAHLLDSSPGEFPGQVPADSSAPAGDQHVLPGQVSQLGWQHQAHGSFHHQIDHLHREQQQGAQPLPDHPLLPGKVLFQTSTKPRWQRKKSNTLHAPPDGWQVFKPLPKLGGKRFLGWKNPSLPLKKKCR